MDPIGKFHEWFEEATKSPRIADATAMALATADAQGKPSVRMVLFKGFERGFVFYTNLESRKGAELKQNPQAALCFYWEAIGKQVRVEGKVEPVSDQEADAYFASRPRESQIGAWASKQSHPLSSREELLKTAAALETKFSGKPVSRPPYWSGWRIVPERIEFWQQGEFRLHDRERYDRSGQGWEMVRLYP